MLLTIDIGNTNITMGIYEGDELLFTSRLATDRKRTSDQYSVELLNIFLHGGLVCRREISGDNVARRPCPGGRAVLRSRYGEHVPVLCGHKHRFRRGAVRSNREQVRSLRQYGAVNDVYGRTRRRQRAGERSLRGVGLRRVHCH